MQWSKYVKENNARASEITTLIRIGREYPGHLHLTVNRPCDCDTLYSGPEPCELTPLSRTKEWQWFQSWPVADPGFPIRREGEAPILYYAFLFWNAPRNWLKFGPFLRGVSWGDTSPHPPTPINPSMVWGLGVQCGRWSDRHKALGTQKRNSAHYRRKLGHYCYGIIGNCQKINDNSCLENVRSWILDFGEVCFLKKAVAYRMISKISSVTAYMCVLLGYCHMTKQKGVLFWEILKLFTMFNFTRFSFSHLQIVHKPLCSYT